jgi:hypothetical protein
MLIKTQCAYFFNFIFLVEEKSLPEGWVHQFWKSFDTGCEHA